MSSDEPREPREPRATADDGSPAPRIRVGGKLVPLPEGVELVDWSLERTRAQNPRLRGLLGCHRLLGEVLDSNYAILHCSPDRLWVIWRRVGRVAELLRAEMGPLLAEPSCVPALEEALRDARAGLDLLDREVLDELLHQGDELPEGDSTAFRKLLCVAIGKLYAYLQETFAQLMAADPRGRHDADYFLSRRFPRDIEEAEWLYSAVYELDRLLAASGRTWRRVLAGAASEAQRRGRLPGSAEEAEVRRFLGQIEEELTPALIHVLTLRGIRFDEMEVLDRWARDLPIHCRIATALLDTGSDVERRQEAAESEVAGRELPAVHRIPLGRRLAQELRQVEEVVGDLAGFVPIWLDNIERRRALIVAKLPQR